MWNILGAAVSSLTSNNISNLHLTFKLSVIRLGGAVREGDRGYKIQFVTSRTYSIYTNYKLDERSCNCFIVPLTTFSQSSIKTYWQGSRKQETNGQVLPPGLKGTEECPGVEHTHPYTHTN